MIAIDTSLEYLVVSVLAVWLAASIMSALGVRPFSTPPLVVFRLFMPWRLFALPEAFFHTLEYLDTTGDRPSWVVAASTRSQVHLPFLPTRGALLADHLDYVTFHLDRALRRHRPEAIASLLAAIERNLGRHPAVRGLAPDRPAALRVVRRRHGADASRDRVVREWIPTLHD